MYRPTSRSLALALRVLLAGAAIGCGDRRSAAADVPKDDVRRLPLSRVDEVPDVMLQAADRGRVLGADSASLQLFVVSDYQCPECQAWFETILPTVRADYVATGRVRLTWVHYPLRAHPNAVAAAAAAMCASAQGKFYEASTAIFSATSRWGAASEPAGALEPLARVPGVDAFTLHECLASRRMLRQIRLDIDWVDKAGHGAPLTVVIGTRRLSGTAPLVAVRAAIDSSLAGK
jgi:predicted DsbA family dithiol-disulfide isomerase